MDNIDEQLLGGQNRDNVASKGSAARAGALNQARQISKRDKNKKKSSANQTGNLADNQDDQPETLREAVRANKAKQNLAGSLKDKAKDAAAAAVSKGTSKLLQAAWENLVDSFGLTLIWIDIHVWLGEIFGNKFFCKLGMEWLDQNIQGAQADYAKSQGEIITTVEPMVLIGCNIGCFFILMIIAVIAYVIIGILTGDVETYQAMFAAVWAMFEGFVGL